MADLRVREALGLCTAHRIMTGRYDALRCWRRMVGSIVNVGAVSAVLSRLDSAAFHADADLRRSQKRLACRLGAEAENVLDLLGAVGPRVTTYGRCCPRRATPRRPIDLAEYPRLDTVTLNCGPPSSSSRRARAGRQRPARRP